MKFEKDRGVYSEPALLHYPLDKPLQVSVHTYKETQYKLNILQTYHDSDYASSGGPYIDPKGYLVAMHIGCEFGQNTMNLPQDMRFIKRNYFSTSAHSCKLSTQILSQKQVYKSLTQSFYLAPIKRHFILDEEGTGYYKYKRANEIPHVHCYAGGFHVKLKNQKIDIILSKRKTL